MFFFLQYVVKVIYLNSTFFYFEFKIFSSDRVLFYHVVSCFWTCVQTHTRQAYGKSFACVFKNRFLSFTVQSVTCYMYVQRSFQNWCECRHQ